MKSSEKISDQKAYSLMAIMVKKICLIYSKEYNKELVELLYQYAKEDIDNKRFTWEMFFKAFRLSAKHCDFFPTYSKIMKYMESVKENVKYIAANRQLPEPMKNREGGKKWIKMIKSKIERKSGINEKAK